MTKIRSAFADKILFVIGLMCVLAVVFALFSQHYLGMRPCAWCVLQRFILLLLALFCFMASIPGLNRWIKNLLVIIGGITSISGIIAAWYQYTVAAEMFSCAQTFADKFISNSGLDMAVPWLFGVYATCMDARVNLFGIEYAIWGLLLFMLCTILIVLSIISRRNHGA